LNKNSTHIMVILDRTGSMEPIRDDTIGGFNTFLDQQQQQPGEATMTLVQFDSQDPYEIIHHWQDVQKVTPLSRETYVPRARTPLFDAMGRGINDLEQNLSVLGPQEKPAKILVVVVTDGQENASREFRHRDIVRMIAEKSKKGWQFVYLSADMDAIAEARSVGFERRSTLAFQKDAQGSRQVWDSLSQKTAAYRESILENAEFAFDEEDRHHPDDPGKEENQKGKPSKETGKPGV